MHISVYLSQVLLKDSKAFWPAKPKRVTFWLFTEKAWQPLLLITHGKGV